MFQTIFKTPIGFFQITASDEGIRYIKINEDPGVFDQADNMDNAHTTEAKNQIEAYFKGNLKEFKLPLDLSSRPKFYQSVWKELLRIPFGEVISYSTIARSIGNPQAVRAVGMANGQNPIPLVVPCHRVIGKDGSLTGFAYGLKMKKWLLNFEWENSRAKAGMLF